MTTGTARAICLACGEIYNVDVGHRCLHPNERIGWDLAEEVTKLHTELNAMTARWTDFENREAACCPEDVEPDEYIRRLIARLALAHHFVDFVEMYHTYPSFKKLLPGELKTWKDGHRD